MRVGTFRRGFGVQSVVLLVICALMAVGGLATPGQASAYQGEQQMWGLQHFSRGSVIVVSRLDTGDVYANTAFVNQIDAQFIRESFGSDYKRIRFAGFEEPVPGTTVVRRFTFTYANIDGTMLVTDEWGPNIWMFIFADEAIRDREIRDFVSATVTARYPTRIPSGYGMPRELDV